MENEDGVIIIIIIKKKSDICRYIRGVINKFESF